MINLCANNYLGLAITRVLEAAHDALARYGYGVASVRSSAARKPCTGNSRSA